jgi:hypothetical protein
VVSLTLLPHYPQRKGWECRIWAVWFILSLSSECAYDSNFNICKNQCEILNLTEFLSIYQLVTILCQVP